MRLLPSPTRSPVSPQWHDGLANSGVEEGFAPELTVPFELTVVADCDAGTFSVERDGELVGGKVIYDSKDQSGMEPGKDLRLAVGTYDDACKVTIVSYTAGGAA